MLVKALVTAIIGGLLFPFFVKLFTRKSLDEKLLTLLAKDFSSLFSSLLSFWSQKLSVKVIPQIIFVPL